MVLGKLLGAVSAIIVFYGLISSPVYGWQQKVDYSIEVKLDTENHHLRGKETVDYFNNSPDTLKQLYFHLYPNAFADKHTTYAKEAYAAGDDRFYYASQKDMGWIDIIGVDGAGIDSYKVEGTLMTVSLDPPLPPNSDLVVRMEFDLKIPKIFSRLGHNGNHYEITQWYPKACVYDDVGWHRGDYHYLGEFYSDFGDYKIDIDLPNDYVVAATGDRFDEKPIDDNRMRISFRAEDVCDFAWVSDKDYIVKTIDDNETKIEIYILPKDVKAWEDVEKWVVQAMRLYGEWYGDYPYKTLKIVDVDGSRGAGMEYPQMVLISGNSFPFTRFHEAQVVHEIAHQWFYGVLANNELDEAWLDEGFATFTEMRYFEETYGDEDNMLNLPKGFPLVPKITEKLLAKYYYYITASTDNEMPLNAPSYLHYRDKFGYLSYYYKGALVLYALRDYMGADAFDAALREYYYKYRFKHPRIADFEMVCGQFSDADLSWFFRQWIESTDKVDYDLKRMEKTKSADSPDSSIRYKSLVYLQRNSDGFMPVEVKVVDRRGEEYSQIWDNPTQNSLVMTFYTKNELSYASIDPNDKSLDYYRWNNHYPRKIKFSFIFDKPDLDAYQLFLIPYAWIVPPNTYRFGAIFQGRQFIDMGPILGKHQWTLFTAYDLEGKTLIHAFNYQTPLGLLGKYTRVYSGWSRRVESQSIWGGLSFSSYGHPFSKSSKRYLDLSFSAEHYSSAFESDPRDVDTGSWLKIKSIYGYTGGGIRFGGGLEAKGILGKDVRNDRFQYGKVSIELYDYLRFSSKLKLFARLYSGIASGRIPAQEQFFFSGKLFPDRALKLTWENTGDLSSQEKWHIWGDGNVRGYFGRHIKGKAIISATIEQHLPLSPIYIFYDAGMIEDNPESIDLDSVRSDCGIGVKLFNLFRADFPFWISDPLNKGLRWDFRVILGFTRGLQ